MSLQSLDRLAGLPVRRRDVLERLDRAHADREVDALVGEPGLDRRERARELRRVDALGGRDHDDLVLAHDGERLHRRPLGPGEQRRGRAQPMLVGRGAHGPGDEEEARLRRLEPGLAGGAELRAGRGRPAVQQILQQVATQPLALCLEEAFGLDIGLRGQRRRHVDVAHDDPDHRQRRRARLVIHGGLKDLVPEHLVVEPEGAHELPQRNPSHAPRGYGPDEQQLLGRERALSFKAAEKSVVVPVDVVPDVRQHRRIVDAGIGLDLAAHRVDALGDDLVLARTERIDDPHHRFRRFAHERLRSRLRARPHHVTSLRVYPRDSGTAARFGAAVPRRIRTSG